MTTATGSNRRVDRGLSGLVAATPTVDGTNADVVAAASRDGVQCVVLDGDGRPTGLIDFSGQQHSVLVVDIDSSAAEVVHLISASFSHPVVLPVIVTDASGEYVGTVGLQGLLSQVGKDNACS